MQADRQHTPNLPVISLLIAATLWGIFWLPLRWLEGMGLQGVWLTMLIYSGTIIYAIPILILHRRELTNSPWHLMGIALSSGWCNTAFILALLDGSVVRVILLFYLSPVWATFLARVVLKENLSRQCYLILLIAISGAITMLWSPDVGYPWPKSLADWLAISSGFAFALTNMFINMAKDISIQLKTAASWMGVIIVAAIVILYQSLPLSITDLKPITAALIVGAILIGIMTVSVVYGVSNMPVHRSAVILLFEIVVSVVSTYLFTHERLGLFEWVGGGAVVFAAYLSTIPHRQSRTQVE